MFASETCNIFYLPLYLPSIGNHTEVTEPSDEQVPPPADKEEELKTLHTTRDDILRLQQISKDVVSAKNNRKRGKDIKTLLVSYIHKDKCCNTLSIIIDDITYCIGNSKRIRSTRQFKGGLNSSLSCYHGVH